MKKSRLFNLLLIFLISISQNGQASENQENIINAETLRQIALEHQIDSIYQTLPSLPDAARLQTLYYLTQLTASGQDAKAELKAINDYIYEAQKQQKPEHEGFMRSSKMVYFFNYDQEDSLHIQRTQHLEFLKKHKLWNFYYNAWLTIINQHLHKGRIQSGLHEAKQMYSDANIENIDYGRATASYLMGKAYQVLSREKDAVNALVEAIDLLKKEDDISLRIMGYRLLTQVLSSEKEYEQLISYALEWKECLNRYQQQMEAKGQSMNLNSSYLYCHLAHADGLMGLSQLNEAETVIKLARECANGRKQASFYPLWDVEARFAELQGDYEKALQIATLNHKLLSEAGDVVNALLVDETRARLFLKTGKGEMAARIYQQILIQQDSLRNIDMASQLDDLRTIYEVDRITAEQKETRNQLFLFILLCVLLVISTISYFIYNLKLKNKNKELYRQIEERAQFQDEIIRLKFNQLKEETKEDLPLFDRLEKKMAEKKLYLQKDLSLDTLADELNTNRTYLSDCIKTGCGKTYSNYISDLRLHAAIKLFEQESNLSVTEISEQVGYGTYTSFYRSFSKRYGINPSEYYKLSKEKNK
ncbi:MAG: helix-turn-helix domain-containing protein [Bacteroidales bacterium]